MKNEIKVYVVNEVNYTGEERFDEGYLESNSKVFSSIQDAKVYMNTRLNEFIQENENNLNDIDIDDYLNESELEVSLEYYNDDYDKKVDIYLNITEQVIEIK